MPTENDFNLFSEDKEPKNVFNKYVLPAIFEQNVTTRFLDAKWTKIQEFINVVSTVKMETDEIMKNTLSEENVSALFEFWKARSSKEDSLLFWILKVSVLTRLIQPFLTKEIALKIIADYEYNFLKKRIMWNRILSYEIQRERRDAFKLLENFFEDIQQQFYQKEQDSNDIQPSSANDFDREFVLSEIENNERMDTVTPLTTDSGIEETASQTPSNQGPIAIPRTIDNLMEMDVLDIINLPDLDAHVNSTLRQNDPAEFDEFLQELNNAVQKSSF